MRDAIGACPAPRAPAPAADLTDGKPNDLDVYGAATAWRTRATRCRTREADLTPFCVTIDEKAHDYLPRCSASEGLRAGAPAAGTWWPG